jgi:hypothetical protein
MSDIEPHPTAQPTGMSESDGNLIAFDDTADPNMKASDALAEVDRISGHVNDVDTKPLPPPLGKATPFSDAENESGDLDVKPSTHRKDSRFSAAQLELVASYKSNFAEEVYKLDPQLTGSNQGSLTKWKKSIAKTLLETGEFDTLGKGDAHAVSLRSFICVPSSLLTWNI